MRDYSFSWVSGMALARLYTITRRDGNVIRLTSWPSSVKIGGDTWSSAIGLKAFDSAERGDGTPASTQLSLSSIDGGAIDPDDVIDGLFDFAELEIDVCDPTNPVARDFEFYGHIGRVSKPLHGAVTFEIRNPFGFPSGGTPNGELVPQFSVMCRYSLGDVYCGIPIWAPEREVARSTSYAVGGFGFVLQTAPNDYGNGYFEVTAITTGITASSAPTFDYIVGHTTTDGGVTWTARNGWDRTCEIGTVVNRHNMTLTGHPDSRDIDGWYAPGKIQFFTGRNKGRRFKIGAWKQSPLQLTTYSPAGLLTVAGDKALISKDCNKTLAMCASPFLNAKRMGGYPYFAGAKAASQQQF